jgi:hypothetical protein
LVLDLKYYLSSLLDSLRCLDLWGFELL